MKLLFLLPTVFVLAACCTKPIAVNPPVFPPISDSMNYKCPELKNAKDSERLSDLIGTVAENYAEYHKCRTAVDIWHEWYKEQRDIYENVKK